jgi:hypothetical protein
MIKPFRVPGPGWVDACRPARVGIQFGTIRGATLVPYHVVAYQANTFGVTNFDSTPLPDAWVTIQNGHYLPHIPLYLYGGWFGGVNLTAVTLVTPRSRMVVPPRLYPIQGSLLPPDRPHIFDRRKNPFTLNGVEEVSLLMNIGGAANAYNTGVMFWGNSLDPVPQGDLYTLHGTSTTAAVANAWSLVNVVWDQTLPAGNYAVISTHHQSTNAIAHRLFFKDQVMRPGFLSISALTNLSEPSYYFGGWGQLGQFNTTAYPTWEVLANAADAAHDVSMTMIRLG